MAPAVYLLTLWPQSHWFPPSTPSWNKGQLVISLTIVCIIYLVIFASMNDDRSCLYIYPKIIAHKSMKPVLKGRRNGSLCTTSYCQTLHNSLSWNRLLRKYLFCLISKYNIIILLKLPGSLTIDFFSYFMSCKNHA